MPRRKQSRMPARAKPQPPTTASNAKVEMQTEEAKEKMRLLLEDYDHEVERRVKIMEDEIESILQSIRQMYKSDLMRYPAEWRNKPWNQCQEEQDKNTRAFRSSMASLVNTAETVLQTATSKKRGRKPKLLLHENSEPDAAPSVSRSTRTTRQQSILGLSNTNTMLPPPTTTTRAQRSRKVMQDILATPANQGIPANTIPLITPKFNPKTPLPPGTIKRHPKLGEIAVSLQGSPLQVSPVANPNIGMEGWIKSLDEKNLDEESRAQLIALHEKVGKMLKV